MTVSGARSPLALRLALRVYPAAYRRDRQDELSEVFCDVTAGAGRLATVREAVDLAGHGVRLRTGLTSSGIPGRLAAAAAPYAAGAAAAWPLLNLYIRARDEWLRGWHLGFYSTGLAQVQLVAFAVGMLTLVAVLWGRWSAARVLGAMTVVGLGVSEGLSVLQFHLWARGFLVLEVLWTVGAPVLWNLLMLAAPPDLLAPVSPRRRVLVAGSMVFVAGVLHETFGREFDHHLHFSLVSLAGVCELGLILAALPALLRGWLLPAALALAGLPLMLFMCLGWLNQVMPGNGLALAFAGALAVVVVVAHVWHPSVPERKGPPTVQ